MAFYYVKSGGTATADAGRATSLRTGSFATMGASAYYDNVQTVIEGTTPTTNPTGGDYILVSSSHSHNYAATTTMTAPSGITPVYTLSVDDSNADQYLAGASEQVTGAAGREVLFSGNHSLRGMTWVTDRDFQTNTDGTIRCVDCTITLTGVSGGNAIELTGGGKAAALFEDCTINFNGKTSTVVKSYQGGFYEFRNCVFATDQASMANCFQCEATNANRIRFVGCDLSIFTTLVNGVSSTTHNSYDNVDIEFHRCKYKASYSLSDAPGGLNTIGDTISSFNSTNSSTAADYTFHVVAAGGEVQDDTATYRNETTVFTDSAQEVSAKAITTSNVDIMNPFWFNLPARYAELSTASTDTLRVYLTSDSSLTDQDVWCKLIYPDGTNKQTPNLVTTANSDALATGTALTTDSTSTYTSGKTNKYYIDIDTSGDVGADCAPILRVYVGKASTTIYFDTTVDVVA